MTLEIINVGDELLNGTSVNTNATWLCGKAAGHGLTVVAVTMVGDDLNVILDALHTAGARARLVLVTGGLGPTSDDKTKGAALRYFGGELVPDGASIERIRKLFEERGLPLTERNIEQGWVPDRATIHANPVGTAPGMSFSKDGVNYVFLPGVPAEMKAISNEHFNDWAGIQEGDASFVMDEIMVTGIGESFVADRLNEWEEKLPESLSLAYLPAAGLVKIRLSCFHCQPCEVRGAMRRLLNEAILLFPDNAFYTGGRSWDQYFHDTLMETKATIATAESCTGGYLSHRITTIPGSSDIFRGGMVAYHNDIKSGWLEVPESMLQQYGAVSPETASQMALSIRQKFSSDLGVAISGIAGPDGGTPEKPVGTVWIAVAGKSGVRTKMFLMGTDRIRNIEKSAVMAMKMALNHLTGP